MRFKSYQDWVNEDFAAVGVAPAGNIVGMGPVVAPSSDSNGSGDTWPSLGERPKKCQKCKKKKCICDETS